MTNNLSLMLSANRVLQRLDTAVDPSDLTDLRDDLQELIETLNTKALTIASNSTNFHEILLQLHERVRRLETWKDFKVSSTGRTLLELVAAIGAFLQSSISVAFRESFSSTAVRASSHYEIARTLGNRIDRKTASKAKVWVRRSTTSEPETVPKFTQFIVDGLEFFNAEPFVFPKGEATLPINVGFDAQGVAIRKEKFLDSVYLGTLNFPDPGQIYFPCNGTVSGADADGNIYTGEVKLVFDPSVSGAVFGSLTINEEVIFPSGAVFTVQLSQYNNTVVNGTFTTNSPSALLRFPGTIPFQFKRTGVGSSMLTPALGTANIPSKMAVVTNEEFSIAKNKYLLPQYLNKSVVVYDNDLFLHSGRIQTFEHTVQNQTDFYSIALNQPGFNVANDFIYVEVFDGISVTTWERAADPIWAYGPEDRVFVDSTLGNGDTVLTFGNGLHGKALESRWRVGIRYVLTKGAIGNGVPINSDVSCPAFSLVGATTTPTYGGGDEKPASYYKTIAPTTFKSKRRAVTLEDQQEIFLSYSNVADVAVLGQMDIAPHDLRHMNRVTVALLPFSPKLRVYPENSLMAGELFDPTVVNPKDPNEPNVYRFSDLELQDIAKRFSKSANSSLAVDVFRYPIAKPVAIKVRAFGYRQYSLDVVSSKLSTRIKNLFARTNGILGRSLLLADIINACKIEEVDYVEVLQPTFDVVLGDGSTDLYTFVCLEKPPEINTEFTSRR